MYVQSEATMESGNVMKDMNNCILVEKKPKENINMIDFRWMNQGLHEIFTRFNRINSGKTK